jgi:hypothetical protein
MRKRRMRKRKRRRPPAAFDTPIGMRKHWKMEEGKRKRREGDHQKQVYPRHNPPSQPASLFALLPLPSSGIFFSLFTHKMMILS